MSWPICINPGYWSMGHIDDVRFDDDDAVELGNEATIDSILGTAHAGNWGDQDASDERMKQYDLLFFSARIDRRIYQPFDYRRDRALFGYRVSGKAVGWDTSEAMPTTTIVDDGTPGELLLPDKPIILPWGAYWCVISTLPEDPPAGEPLCNTISNNDLWLGVVPLVAEIVDGVKFPFELRPREYIDGLDAAGLYERRILGEQAISFRVNRRDWAS